MSVFLDILLVAVFAFCVVYGYKNGFFKAAVNLLSGVVSVMVSYTFTPPLAELLKEKIVLKSVSDAITKAFASAAQTVSEETGEAAYDITRILENSQVVSVAEHYGVGPEALEEMIGSLGESSYEAIEALALSVADGAASTISMVAAFAVLFICTTVVLKIVTSVIGGVFKLPVIRSMNTLLGCVAGALCGALFVWVISVTLAVAIPALGYIAPGAVTEDTYSKTVMLKFFAENSIIDIFSKMLG